MKQFSERNITMMMDLYEMTMANGYFNDQDQDARVAFDIFYRKNPDNGGFAIFAGLEQIIEYIENLHFSEEDIEYFKSLNLFNDTFLSYLTDSKVIYMHFMKDVSCIRENLLLQSLHH